MEPRSWRAFYADGSEYVPGDELPAEGLVCVVVYYREEYRPGRPYRRIVNGGDWYWCVDGRWHRTVTGDWGTWEPRPAADAIRSTERLPETTFEEIMSRAFAAREAPDGV